MTEIILAFLIGAIVGAGALIAVAFYFSDKSN